VLPLNRKGAYGLLDRRARRHLLLQIGAAIQNPVTVLGRGALLWVAAVFALCSACQQPKSPARLRLGLVNLHSYGLLYVAEDHGFMQDEGVDLELSRFEAGRDALDQVAAGKLDLATVYLTPVAIRTLQGLELSAITRLHFSTGLHAIVARAGSKIRTDVDLKGKKLGFTPNTSSEGFVRSYLATHGLDREDVQLVPGDPLKLIELLATGEVDAACLWHPRVWDAEDRLGGASTQLTSNVYMEISMLVGMRARMAELEPALLRLLKALARAEALADQNPQVLAESLRKRFPQLPEERLKFLLQHARFEIGLSNIMLTALEQEAHFLAQPGTAAAPDLRQVLRPDLLMKVAPQAVTLSSMRGEL
jgi:NitT/TauT family transport system substrate-binding protein